MMQTVVEILNWKYSEIMKQEIRPAAVFLCVYIDIYIHTYMYIYICMYTYVYIHIYKGDTTD